MWFVPSGLFDPCAHPPVKEDVYFGDDFGFGENPYAIFGCGHASIHGDGGGNGRGQGDTFGGGDGHGDGWVRDYTDSHGERGSKPWTELS